MFKALDYSTIINHLKNDFIQNINQISHKENVNCNYIFAKFIYEIGSKVSSNNYIEICTFILLFRKAANLIGWNIKGEMYENSEKSEFCEFNNAEYLPFVTSEFISDFLAIFLKENSSEYFKNFGEDFEMKKVNVAHLTDFFSKWLYNNNFSSYKAVLIMNEEELKN